MSAVLQFLKALPKFTAVNLQKVSARNAVKLWCILVKIGKIRGRTLGFTVLQFL